MKQVDVTLLGQVYVLGCPDGGEALLRVAVASVDKEMVGIRDAGKVKARERIAVLAALNLAYQLAERGTLPQESVEVGGVNLEALIRRVDAALGDDGQLL